MKICQGKSHRLWCTCRNNTVCPGLSFACFLKEQVSQIMMHLQQQQQSSYTLHWSKDCADPPPMLENDPLWIATHWVMNSKGGLTCLIRETLGIEEGLAGGNPEMRSLKDRVLSSFPGFMSSWKNPPWSSRERKVTYKAIGLRLLLPKTLARRNAIIQKRRRSAAKHMNNIWHHRRRLDCSYLVARDGDHKSTLSPAVHQVLDP